MNMMQLLQMMQSGGNPMMMLQQMMGGKSPAQLRQMAQNMAQQRGMSLEQIAGQFGLKLPK